MEFLVGKQLKASGKRVGDRDKEIKRERGREEEANQTNQLNFKQNMYRQNHLLFLSCIFDFEMESRRSHTLLSLGHCVRVCVCIYFCATVTRALLLAELCENEIYI